MAKRSPILGYNHNIRHRGLVFHVQTEDSGVDNPHIFTHVFHGGVILNSRKLVYDAGADEDVVKSLMQAQHKALLKDLKSGKLADKIDLYLGGNPDLLPFDSGHDPVVRPETQPFHPMELEAVEQRASRSQDPAAVADTVELREPPGDVSAAFAAVKVPDMIPPQVRQPAPPPAPVRPPAPSVPPVAPVVSFKGADAPGSPADGTYRQHRPNATPPPSRAVTRHAQPPPPTPATRQAVPAARPASKSGQVVVSRPAVIVGAPSRVVGSAPAAAAPAAPKPRARTARTRTATEKSPESLFGQGLISEKSLDEVILAYLSDDSSEE